MLINRDLLYRQISVVNVQRLTEVVTHKPYAETLQQVGHVPVKRDLPEMELTAQVVNVHVMLNKIQFSQEVLFLADLRMCNKTCTWKSGSINVK